MGIMSRGGICLSVTPDCITCLFYNMFENDFNKNIETRF